MSKKDRSVEDLVATACAFASGLAGRDVRSWDVNGIPSSSIDVEWVEEHTEELARHLRCQPDQVPLEVRSAARRTYESEVVRMLGETK
jgi:hypothetical protein